MLHKWRLCERQLRVNKREVAWGLNVQIESLVLNAKPTLDVYIFATASICYLWFVLGNDDRIVFFERKMSFCENLFL